MYGHQGWMIVDINSEGGYKRVKVNKRVYSPVL
jgi:hypothetical protein